MNMDVDSDTYKIPRIPGRFWTRLNDVNNIEFDKLYIWDIMSRTARMREAAKIKGKCDICNTKKAKHWFGYTSVALCGDETCSRINRARWDRMIEEMKDDERNRG